MDAEKPKIFIVDNEIEICNLFKDFFDFMGYDSVYETDGKKFLNNLKSIDYDVLFLDIRLDNISGMEILKKSKEIHPLSEVIIVTGFGSDETVMSSLKYGALSYIQKPISFSEISVQTELALSTRRFNTLSERVHDLIAKHDSSLFKHCQNVINLDRFSTFLNMSIDIESLADSILNGIDHLLPCEYCAFLFADKINGEIVVFSRDPIKRSIMEAIENDLIRSFECLVNKKLDKKFEARACMSATIVDDNPDKLPELSAFFVPIFIENSIQGLLSISNESGAFTPDVQDILRLISNRASRVLTNATLHRDTKLLALTDGLTGLLNHRAFRDRLVGEFERHKRYSSHLSLIIADFDDLKDINDNYGHPVGDKILRKVGDILRETSRESDVLARYGGDEFVILLPQTNIKNASNMAERIGKKVKNYEFDIQGHIVKSSLSMGIASSPHEDINSPDDLFDTADRALYEAKRSGKDCFRVSGSY